MSFNMNLKEFRLRNNLTQEQLARKLDIVTRTYINYEKGTKYPPVETLMRMAKYFEVSISFLMDEQNESPMNVQELKYGTPRADRLVKEISDLFAGGELSQADKDAVMEALQETYWAAKKKSK